MWSMQQDARNDMSQMTQQMNKLEHYPCMTDFLDLVCYLHEAKDIIKARSWGSHVMMQICALCLQNFWRCGDYITKLVLKKFEILQAICFQQVFSIRSVCCRMFFNCIQTSSWFLTVWNHLQKAHGYKCNYSTTKKKKG